jgi:hypothetical protein
MLHCDILSVWNSLFNFRYRALGQLIPVMGNFILNKIHLTVCKSTHFQLLSRKNLVNFKNLPDIGRKRRKFRFV